jgi:hypothetical protein
LTEKRKTEGSATPQNEKLIKSWRKERKNEGLTAPQNEKRQW